MGGFEMDFYYGTPEFHGDLMDVTVDGIPFKFEVVKETEYDEPEYSLIFYHELSNGQTLSVAFIENDYFTYSISMNIANTAGYARLWHFIGEVSDETTGTCGLEGLRKAYKLVKWFSHEILPECHSISIYSYGQKAKAYKFLERIGFYNSFTGKESDVSIFEYENGEPKSITVLETLTDIDKTLANIRKFM